MARSNWWCRAHKRARPCSACELSSERFKAQWASKHGRAALLEGIRAGHRCWTAAERAIVERIAGKASAADIAAVLAREGFTRTVGAIYLYCHTHKIDVFREGRTAREIQLIFGFTDRSSYRSLNWWVREGFLKGQKYGNLRVFSDEEIENFIREQPWAYDVERMPQSRFRQLAEVVRRRDPWLKTTEVAPLVGCSMDTLYAYLKTGAVETRRRFRSPHGALMVRASSLPALREWFASAGKRRSQRQPRSKAA